MCVFCGSSAGTNPEYIKTAKELGRYIATSGRTLVYGGAAVGTMGALADGALGAGGKVVGVMPTTLKGLEVAHPGLTEFYTVQNMHERKQKMAELSDCFVALPGGLGTLDEIFDIISGAQLQFHSKPVALLNVLDYYKHLSMFLDHVCNEGFLMPIHRNMIGVFDSIEMMFEWFENYNPPALDMKKWVEEKKKGSVH
ncbi:MAG: TIGR00730 family Rossman fold protein [Thermoplasmata archaeon]